VGLFKKLPYDTVKDLAPVSTLGFFDLGVFVPSGSRFAKLRDLLRYAKDHPGELKVGTISVGTTQHLAAQLFQSVAGVEMLTVPYKGTGAVTVALRSGEIDVGLEIVGPMVPQVNSNAVRLLAVTGERPNPAVPSAPTAQEAGLPGYNVASWNAIAVPAGTPAPVIERLNQAARDALAAPKVRAALEPLGVRLQPSTPAQAQALVAVEIKRWGDVIRAAKIQPQ
jgi:tripartite-type tricarboxylate transporter receptor subunit TctC